MSYRCWTKKKCSHDERTNCATICAVFLHYHRTMHVQLTHPCPLLHQFFKRSVTDHGRAAGCLGRRQRGGGGPGAAGAAGRRNKTGGRPSTRRAQYQRVETIRGGTGASRWGHDGLAPSGSDVVVRCLVAGGLGLVVVAHGNGGKMVATCTYMYGFCLNLEKYTCRCLMNVTLTSPVAGWQQADDGILFWPCMHRTSRSTTARSK